MIETRAHEGSVLRTKRGTKQTCNAEGCGSRYYDLSRAPPTCPYCGAVCDTPGAEKIDFENFVKQPSKRFIRWAEPAKPLAQASADGGNDEAIEKQTDDEAETSSPEEELLIDADEEGEVDVSDESLNEAS
jgi:hypothetical protein